MNRAEAMEEALMQVSLSCSACPRDNCKGCTRPFASFMPAVRKALVMPKRNCDVGTAEEQADRLVANCKKFHHCVGCQSVTSDNFKCELVWAQLPYESEAASIKSVQSVHSQTAKCAGCGRGIDVRYDEYVEIGQARYCPKCYVRRKESEAKE